MKRLLPVLFVLLSFTACSGISGDADAGQRTIDAGPQLVGPQPIKYTTYTKRSDGWPAGAKIVGAGVLDNVLFVATDKGVVSLPATDTTWSTVITPLTGDLKPTSLQRVDQSLVMTAAGATTGGLYVKPLDGPFTASTAAPTKPAWALVRKSPDWLLVTTGGLYAGADLTGAFSRRSAAATPLFTHVVPRFVAAPSQQKMFASGDSANALGGLFESSDVGATWTASTLQGNVSALTALGAYVLVATSTDGQQRSDNYGNTFRAAGAPITGTLQSWVVQNARIWAVTSDGLMSSDDNGASFTANSGGLPAGTLARGLFFAGSYAIVDTADGPWITQVE
jgi:hypothetical protein